MGVVPPRIRCTISLVGHYTPQNGKKQIRRRKSRGKIELLLILRSKLPIVWNNPEKNGFPATIDIFSGVVIMGWKELPA